MIVITTMDSLPNYCYGCPCHDRKHSTCEADKEKRSTFEYEYRPCWCPLKEISSDADREKVINGLKECIENGNCVKCQYGKEKETLSCRKLLIDALELIKDSR